MSLDINLYVHAVPDPVVLALLEGMREQLTRIEAKELLMAGELDALTAQVAANTDAEQSAIVLLGNLKRLLDAAGTDPVKLAALSSTLATSKDALAAAIVENTPAG